MSEASVSLDVRDLPVATFVCHLDGQVVVGNAAFVRILGLESEERVGGERVGRWFADAVAGAEWLERPQETELVVALRGQVKRLRLNGTRRAGDIVGTLTDLGQLEEGQIYQSLVDNAPFALVIIQDGIVVFANRVQEAAIASVGRKAADLVDAHMHPDDRALVIERIAARQRGETVPHHYIYRHVHGENVRWLEVWSTLIEYRGRPAVQAISIDVTERVQVEQELARATHLMHDAQKLEAVGRVAGGVAHDFNNMLTVILACARLAMRTPGLPEKVVRELDQISATSMRASELTRQLLLFSARDTARPELIEVGMVLREMEQMLERLLGEHIGLRRAASAVPMWVRVNRGRFEQVVANLVVNARDAMPEGGDVEIVAELGDDGSTVHLAIVDRGPGIPDELVQKVFEPFFTTKDHGKGTGLGLAVVRGIVEQAGGRIWLDTGAKGTTVHIELGLATPTRARELTEVRAVETAPSRDGRILMVEDDASVREALRGVIADAGFEVVACAGAQQALARLAAEAFDLVITDVIMPEMNGVELARVLAREYPALPVLFLTGYADDRLLELGHSADRTILRKPIGADELVDAVAEALAARASAPSNE